MKAHEAAWLRDRLRELDCVAGRDENVDEERHEYRAARIEKIMGMWVVHLDPVSGEFDGAEVADEVKELIRKTDLGILAWVSPGRAVDDHYNRLGAEDQNYTVKIEYHESLDNQEEG